MYHYISSSAFRLYPQQVNELYPTSSRELVITVLHRNLFFLFSTYSLFSVSLSRRLGVQR